jgi:hypothetical protein
VLGDGRLRGDAEVARDLRVGRLVAVALDEAHDVFEDFPLALRAWLHSCCGLLLSTEHRASGGRAVR